MRHRRGAKRWGSKSGISVLEVTIALTIVSTVLMASAGAFMSSIYSVNSAQRTSHATVYLETVMEDLSAQPYDDLLSFDGDRLYDQATAGRSNYGVDLTVFATTVDLLQIRAVLVDLRTNREIGRLTTLRSKR